MRYLVDEALCCGHGRCAVVAPAVFALDEDEGVNAVLGTFVVVPPEQESEARAGAGSCPDAAIRIFDDSSG